MLNLTSLFPVAILIVTTEFEQCTHGYFEMFYMIRWTFSTNIENSEGCILKNSMTQAVVLTCV